MENNKRKFVLFKIHVRIFAINKNLRNNLLTTEKSFSKTQVGKSNVN